MTRREKLAHLLTARIIVGKHGGGIQSEKMSGGSTKWPGAGRGTDELKVIRGRISWKVTICKTREQGTSFSNYS